MMCKYPAIIVNHTIFSFLFHLKELMWKKIHPITAIAVAVDNPFSGLRMDNS